MIKNTADDSAMPAKVSVDILPAYSVSTTLNIVWKKNPTLVGIAIFLINPEILPWVISSSCVMIVPPVFSTSHYYPLHLV